MTASVIWIILSEDIGLGNNSCLMIYYFNINGKLWKIGLNVCLKHFCNQWSVLGNWEENDQTNKKYLEYKIWS